VVKIALRMTLLSATVDGLTPLALSVVTQSRTSSGRMSIIRIGPNSGTMCRYREYVYRWRVLASISWFGSQVSAT